MEIAPASIEVCLKLNRFVCGEAENDVVALRDAHVRILSSHELGTLVTVPFSDGAPAPVSLPPSRPPTQRDFPKSNASMHSVPRERQKKEPQIHNQNAVYIDSTTEERPKRNASKFLQLINQERKSRWSHDQTFLPIDGVDSFGGDNSTRLIKGMHSPPKFESGTGLNPLRQEQQVAKQLRDEMFMGVLAQQRSQNFADNLSQVSGMSAKERILRTGHATGIPDNLRQL